MKNWKYWLIGISMIVVLSGIALISAVWNNLGTEWRVEAQAAQFALDHSPINHIDRHSVFTADGAQEVFYGTDVFQHPWYVFVSGNPYAARYVPATGVLPVTALKRPLTEQRIEPASYAVGFLTNTVQHTFQTRSTIVWEVHGRNDKGRTVYAYFDAFTGAFVWKYVL